MSKPFSIPLPRNWSRHIKRALLAAISLERIALAEVRAGLENSPDPRAQLLALLDRSDEMHRFHLEVIRILQARMAAIPPGKRPHYTGPERLAILKLKAALGWTAAETAHCFGITAATVTNWMRRLDEGGPEALLETNVPVNRFDDGVTELVQHLHQAAPHLGRRKKAEILLRAGVSVAESTVERIQHMPPKPMAPTPEPKPPEQAKARASAKADTTAKRVVTAREPHHVWHVDLTTIAIGPIGSGFWTAWWPFALVLQWALSWHIALVVDHFSRAIVDFAVLRKEPTAAEICALLDAAVFQAGRAPKYIVSDRGSQFQSEYRTWCARNGVKPRFGAVGQKGSIAIVERVILTLKSEFLWRIFVPYSLAGMQAALSAFQTWYNEHRPHSALRGRTPAELRDGVVSAIERERIEPRAHYPLPRTGPPVRRARGRLTLVVTHVGGFRELPVVQLREAA